MRSIADAAEVPEATVYAVFRSKAGLALALVDAAGRDADRIERWWAETLQRLLLAE